MFRSSRITVAIIAAQLCSYSYGQTRAVLVADTPVRIRPVQSISATMQRGQYVEFQVADAVWCGNVIAIPRGAVVIGMIATINKLLFRRITEIEVNFLYVLAASGERVPLHSGQDLRADWKVRLVKGSVPSGAETTAYVSREMEVSAPAATEWNRSGGVMWANPNRNGH
jgi:hypothetical protein